MGSKPNLKKYVIIVAPHTSSQDFFVGWGARNIIGFRPNFLAKEELFRIPVVGWFLRSLGGVSVDRKKKNRLVDQVVQHYKDKDEFIMTITPEGTREYSPIWKTGFHRIACQADVPIVKVAFDYPSKTVYVDEPFFPTVGKMEEDIEKIKAYYRRFVGKYPERGVK